MAEHLPKITVLIPTFNRANFLAECLDSILAQTLPAAQIIVVNDGSTDSTVEALRPYMGSIDYYETKHTGKPAALNLGLQKTSGDYLWVFDDDDVALPDALERFSKPLEKDPRYGFSYSTYFFTASRPDNKLGEVMYEFRQPDLEKQGPLIPLLESNALGGAALFARTSCYREVGPFDPGLLRSQDYEMAIRIVRRFTGVRVEGGATFHYRQHLGPRGGPGNSFSSSLREKKWLEYDQMIFQRLYRELPLRDYLPPGASIKDRQRQALLQRCSAMAGKMLEEEALDDLREIARLPDQGPLTGEEKEIVRGMAGLPYYGAGSVLEGRDFWKTLKEGSRNSSGLRSMKREILRASLGMLGKKPRRRGGLSALRRLFLLACA